MGVLGAASSPARASSRSRRRAARMSRAPARAKAAAQAAPMPLEAPVMSTVCPRSSMAGECRLSGARTLRRLRSPVGKSLEES